VAGSAVFSEEDYGPIISELDSLAKSNKTT
jgi:hypothetical protein